MAATASQLPAVNLAKLVRPIAPQREFLQKVTNFDFVLYEGEGGAGKSYILRWGLVLFLIACWQKLGLRGVRTGLFCEDYPALEDRQISKIRAEFPRGLGQLKQTRTLDFVLREEYGGGSIGLRNLDDPGKYSSSEFAAIAVDELTRNKLQVFNDLRWRLRWPGVERAKFMAATNPGGVGHAWVKKYWITKEYPPEFTGVDPRTGKPYDITGQFARVTARTLDNPFLSASYHPGLLTLPPEMARAKGLGDWDIYVGQYFPFFDKKIHVIPHAEAMRRIAPWHPRALSGDWGYYHPHCFHWHAKNERNEVTTFFEQWDRLIHETSVGQRITEAESQFHKLRPLDSFVFSWDAGKLSPRSEKGQPKSTSQLLQDGLGPRIPRPHPSDSTPGVRLIRARLMSQALGHPGDPQHNIPAARPFWYISDRCTKLIESIPEMIRDDEHERPEEMQKLDWNETQIGDDPVDSAGTGLQWLIGTAVKPREVELEERMNAIRRQFAERTVDAGGTADEFFSRFRGRKF